MEPVLTVGSLFSGIGGLDLGLERAGMSTAWQVELDPYCRAVLARHWPTIHRYQDARKLPHDLPRTDVLAGGFPCQPVSSAGRQLAQEDARWLWPVMRSLIERQRPEWVVIENVLGLRRRGLRDVLADLARLGFDAEWSSISACSLGAPHMRRRLLVVAHANEVRRDGWTRLQQPGGWDEPTDQTPQRRDHWPPESSVDRTAYGVPRRLERVGALGNAVVPAVAEWVGQRIASCY